MTDVLMSHKNQRAFASVNDIHRAFHEHRAEIEWLAYFITGDRTISAVCVAVARASSEAHNSVFVQQLLNWARHATVLAAIDTQRDRIKQVSGKYGHSASIHPGHEPLTGETLELLVQQSDVLIARLDVVSRTALIICGVQKDSIAEAAVMLGVSRTVASAAYSAALDCVEVICYEQMAHEDGGTVMCN